MRKITITGKSINHYVGDQEFANDRGQDGSLKDRDEVESDTNGKRKEDLRYQDSMWACNTASWLWN